MPRMERISKTAWIVGFSSLGVTEGHRWITGVLLLGALAFAALVAWRADLQGEREHPEPRAHRPGSDPLPAALSIGVVLVAMATFARLFGDREPWSFYLFVGGAVVLALSWLWARAHRPGAGGDRHDGPGAGDRAG